MKKKKNRQGIEQKLVHWLKHRIRLLENAKQHYEQNPNLMKNIRTANIEIIQSDIAALKKLLIDIMIGAVPERD